MNKKTILISFAAVLVLILAAGVLSYYMAANQPSADVGYPPVPPVPSNAPIEKPFVPSVPRLSGDVLDDGRVDSLDINSLIVNWKTDKPEYNLVDDPSGQTGILNALDLSQTIKYWKCLENKTGCPYLTQSVTNAAANLTAP